MRYGTRTHARRRWSRQGRRPVCPVKLGYEWGYLYVALCPFSGDVFPMLLSHLDKECFSAFARQLEEHVKEAGIEKVLLIGDGASAHTSQQWPEYRRLDWVKLPTACPELNPVERFFEELRKGTANRVWESKQQLEEYLQRLVLNCINAPDAVVKLTLYDYMKAE